MHIFTMFYFLIHIATVTGISKNKNCTFCRQDHVGAVWSHFISVQDIVEPTRHNVSSLTPIVALLASEFKIVACYINGSNYGSLSLGLPILAAAYWNGNASDKNSIEAWILIAEPSTQNFLKIGKVINEIESVDVDARTISSLIVLPNIQDNFNLSILHDHLLNGRNTLPKNNYNFGFAYSIKHFAHSLTNQTKILRENIISMCQLVNTIVFISEFEQDVGSPVPVHLVVEGFLNLVNDSFHFIQLNCNKQILQSVLVAWPDTSNQGIINYSRLVEFWKIMVKSAKSLNITVIFDRAFDVPSSKSSIGTLGWWRLVENSSYTDTSQFVFQNKQEIAANERNRSKENELVQIKDNFKFNKENLALLVTLFPKALSGKEFHPVALSLLPAYFQTISNKFSKLVLKLSDLEVGYGMKCVKKVGNILGKNASNLEFPFEVFLWIDSYSHLDTESIVEQMLEIHQLHPNVISRVIVEESRDKESLGEHKKLQEMIYVKNMTHRNIAFSYMMPMNYCSAVENSSGWETVKSAVKLGSSVYFSYILRDTEVTTYQYGIERVLMQITVLFESCKRIVNRIAPEVQVGFATGFSDSVGSRDKDYASLVLFWKSINFWANETNTTVIFVEALDSNPSLARALSSMGWWIVKYKSGQASHLVFEEKHNVLLKTRTEALEQEQVSASAAEIWLLPTITAMSVVFVATTVVVVYFLLKKYGKPIDSIVIIDTTLRDIKNSDILILHHTAFCEKSSVVIGNGNFGTVFKVYIPQFHTDHVAVKTMSDKKDAEQVKSLVSEMEIMSHVGHHENILRLLGVCYEQALFIVTEYCENGSLLTYLRSQAAEKIVPSNYELLQFCTDICDGMDYLQQKNVIHADLSCRNVLVDSMKTCKISDFGLSRKLEQYKVYTKKGEEPLPWRWMAIESLTRLEFSFKSDVWSMGVTFWEIFTLGQIPFPEMTWDGAFCKKLEEGMRLGKPELANDDVYKLLRLCWSLDCNERPSSKMLGCRMRELKSCEYAVIQTK